MTADKYPAFPKIPRLHREVILTEKIDGTNGLISIQPWDWLPVNGKDEVARLAASHEGVVYTVQAGSRSRWITPEQDNFGFAQWVHDHAGDLVALGPGNHYGEWWGSGIQRGYGLAKGEKRFSLFNTGRWTEDNTPDCVHVVPVLARTTANLLNTTIDAVRRDLEKNGSWAAPGFMRPEGIIVYHVAGGHTYKVLLECDETPKGLTA